MQARLLRFSRFVSPIVIAGFLSVMAAALVAFVLPAAADDYIGKVRTPDVQIDTKDIPRPPVLDLNLGPITVPGFSMPVFEPNPGTDYKILTMIPDPTIDYTIIDIMPRSDALKSHLPEGHIPRPPRPGRSDPGR